MGLQGGMQLKEMGLQKIKEIDYDALKEKAGQYGEQLQNQFGAVMGKVNEIKMEDINQKYNQAWEKYENMKN